MIKQIRKSKHFIYLQNQYFLGSAYAWLNDKETLCDHLIPRELTQKIIEKIACGESFKVYVVIPMFPEGDPTGYAHSRSFVCIDTFKRFLGKYILCLETETLR